MEINERKAAFISLGKRLLSLSTPELESWQQRAKSQNRWFTPESIRRALDNIAFMLQPAQLDTWLKAYTFPAGLPKRIGVIMAGNIPAVGFHDFLCVLLSGHILRAKLSLQDMVLLKEIAALLIEIEPCFEAQIQFVDRLTDIDAVIATGSNNSARYFNYYFGKLPHIIRQNRTSCAVLTGKEDATDLLALGHDILQYFGLSCRNVSKLYVPADYDFTLFMQSIEPLKPLIDHHKYANNYDYQRAALLINQIPHYDNGFLLLTYNEALVSPTAVVYYETYANGSDLPTKLQPITDQLQCIVSKNGWYTGSLAFGQAQCAHIWDYPDGIDTLKFLVNLL